MKFALRNTKTIWLLVLAALLVLIAVDRSNWARVSQWREDQSATMWLGFTQSAFSLPVGLISSVHTPNPNGMPLFALLLSRLPNLWSVSTTLGILQGILVLWIGWLVVGRSTKFFLLTLPVLASVILRATSVEFWNQWVMTSINLFYFGLLVYYLNRPSVWKVPLLLVPMLLAPAFYLAGLANAVVFFLLAALVMVLKPPHGSRKTWRFSVLACVLLVGAALWLTWIPYAQAMAGQTLPSTGMDLESLKNRFMNTLQSLVDFPIWNEMHWVTNTPDYFYQSSTQILPIAAKHVSTLTHFLTLGQSAIFMALLALALVILHIKRRTLDQFFLPGRQRLGAIVLLSMAFVVLSFVVSAALLGPFWANGVRTDQTVQFLPFVLMAWFGFPFVVRLPRWVRFAAVSLTGIIAAAFVISNLVLGAQVVSAHLDYRGSYLSDADVPLVQKEQVVGFIAQDWESVSTSKTVAVTYDLGGNKWNYLPEFGQPLEQWYPAPMTMGRAFDYELRRVYGLSNSQEGIQLRPLFPTRYVVSYAFMPEPVQAGVTLQHFIFGRLRVSVVQTELSAH